MIFVTRATASATSKKWTKTRMMNNAMKNADPMCGACKKPITICEECGGKMCVADCPDREEDGCTCEEDQNGDDDACGC